MVRVAGDVLGGVSGVNRASGGGDRIFGIAMIGPEAGEVMAVVQMAMLCGLRHTVRRDAILSHPTIAGGTPSSSGSRAAPAIEPRGAPHPVHRRSIVAEEGPWKNPSTTSTHGCPPGWRVW